MLEDLGRASRARAESDMKDRPLFDLEALIETFPPSRKFSARLRRDAGPAPRIIAGMERSTPGGGPPRRIYRPRQIAMGYARVGAAAISVMTEPEQFGGDLDHISEARPAHLPILRNDFLVTPYQVAQSRVAGADAVLLIAGLLAGGALGIMINAAQRYGVEALVEIHDDETLERAMTAGADLVAVNSREPGAMRIDLDAGLRLCSKIGPGAVRVARGGIGSRADVDRLSAAGYDALFVGGQLMRADDPADALWALMQPSV